MANTQDVNEIQDKALIMVEQVHIKFNQPKIANRIFDDVKQTLESEDFFILKYVPYIGEFTEISNHYKMDQKREQLGNEVFNAINEIIPKNPTDIKTLHAINLLLETPSIKQYVVKNTDYINLKASVTSKISLHDSVENVRFRQETELLLEHMSFRNKLVHEVNKINHNITHKTLDDQKLSIDKLKAMGVDTNEKLNKLLETNSDLREHISNAHEHMVKQQRIETCGKSFAFLAQIGAHVQNKDLYRIGAIGYNLSNITSAIDNMNNVGNIFKNLISFASIGGSVLAIAGLFQKKGPSEIQMFARIFQETISKLATVMNERFDRIEKQLTIIHYTCINEFIQLKNINYRIENMLVNVEAIVKNNLNDIKIMLTTINEKLMTVLNNQQLSERYHFLQEIYVFNNKVAGPFALTSEEFKNLFTVLKTYICDTVPNNRFVNGSAENLVSTVSGFESDSDFDFNIKSITKHINYNHPVSNPIIYSWLSCIFMILIQSRYGERTDRKISKTELNEVKKVLELGNHIKEFLTKVNNFDKNATFNNYKNQVKQVKTDYDTFYQSRLAIIKEKNKLAKEKFYENYHNKLKERFKIQDVPVNADVPGCYNDSITIGNYHDAKGRYRRHQYPINKPNYGWKHKNAYSTNLNNQVADFKTKYLGWFVEPVNGQKLILAYPNNYNPVVNDKVKELEQFQKGYYKFTYTIEGNKLVLTQYFVINNKEIPLNRHKYDCNPTAVLLTLSKNPNSLWFYWHGGNYSRGEHYRQCITEGVYEHYSTAPTPTSYTAVRNTVPTVENIYVENNIITTAYNNLQNELKTMINGEYLNIIENNKTVIDMAYNHYLLKSMGNLEGYNRKDFIRALKNNQPIASNVSFVAKIIDHKVLDYTVNMLNNIVKWYDNNNVDSNELDNSIDNEKNLTEENRLLRQVTSVIGQAVMTVITEDQQKQIMQLLRANLSIEGLNKLHLLQN